jgi:hypothetical protein
VAVAQRGPGAYPAGAFGLSGTRQVFSLRRPSDYTIEQGALPGDIEKGRGLHGEHAKPFEAQLEVRDGQTAWSVKDADRQRVSPA